MTNTNIIETIETLREYEALLEETREIVESLKDTLKNEMIERNVTEMPAGQYIVRYQDVLSNRFNSSEFKKTYAELYKAYVKQVSSKRFSISA